MLGWLLNLGFAGGTAVVLVSGPFYVAAAEVYVAGAAAAQVYVAGAVAGEVYVAGASAAQVRI